jgi:SAM-dependent methyltransferase
MGLVMLGWAAASTAGPLLAGALADSASDAAAYAVLIAFCAIVGTWLLRAGRRAQVTHPPVDLDRLYAAGDLDELREEYDRIATSYDVEVGEDMSYASPRAVAAVAERLLERDARILDAGAGTGLLGEELAEAGFQRVDGLDMSSRMLGEAARKGVYRDLRTGTLGKPLGYETAAYDGVLVCGVLTAGHAPAASLEELVRVTRRGGHVIFTLRSDRDLPGFDDKIAELERSRRWELVERGDEFQALPGGEPAVRVRVWAFRVLEPEAA